MSDIGEAELKMVTPERQKALEDISGPIVGYLLMQDPKVAIDALVLTVATSFLLMEYKDGKTPLSLLDAFTNAARKTIETEIEARNSRYTLVGEEAKP